MGDAGLVIRFTPLFCKCICILTFLSLCITFIPFFFYVRHRIFRSTTWSWYKKQNFKPSPSASKSSKTLSKSTIKLSMSSRKVTLSRKKKTLQQFIPCVTSCFCIEWYFYLFEIWDYCVSWKVLKWYHISC